MKIWRFIAGFLLAANLCAPVYAQDTRAQMNTLNNTVIVPNGVGAITASNLNPLLGVLINGMCTIADQNNCPVSSLAGGPLGYVLTGQGISSAPIWSTASAPLMTPQDFGATGNGTTNDTTAMNNFLAYTGPDGKFIPCGTYLVSQLTWPSAATSTQVNGAGPCAIIMQDAADAANNILTLGDGVVNNIYDIKLSNVAINAAVTKTSGAGIYGKGVARPIFENVYMNDGHMFNGIQLDGADFTQFKHVYMASPIAQDGILIYDGFDCGFTPVSTTTNGATSTSSAVVLLANTAGISVGMSIYDVSLGGNAYFTGTVQSIVANTSVTLTQNANFAISSGNTVVFGATCGPTGVQIDGDSQISGAANAVHISGGIGGVEINSMDELLSNHGFVSDANDSHGIPNREIFMGPGSFIDSNTQQGLYMAANSYDLFTCTGCWISASSTSGAVQIFAQTPQHNPVETGAITTFTGAHIAQSDGAGITWADTGVLSVTGSTISYNFGASGGGIYIEGTADEGRVIVENNQIANNALQPVNIFDVPAYGIFTGNIWTGNGDVPEITPSSTILCSVNLGGTSGC